MRCTKVVGASREQPAFHPAAPGRGSSPRPNDDTGPDQQGAPPVIVIDARDIEADSAFWAGILGGTVHRDDDWHNVVVRGEWVMGVQPAPNHAPPQWPTGDQQQQIHLDPHVDDLEGATTLAAELGGRQLQAPRRP